MNKRLRKKKHIKEFTRYAFQIEFEYQSDDWINWSDNLIAQIEYLGFSIGGGLGPNIGNMIICRDYERCPFSKKIKYVNTSEIDRINFFEKIQRKINFTKFKCGDLVDMNK